LAQQNDLRQTWREEADAAAPLVRKLWMEVLEGADREIKHDIVCKCGRRHSETFKIPDLKERSAAAAKLMEFGWGRPGTAEPQQAGKLAEEMSGAERRALLAEIRKRLGGESNGEAVGGGSEQAAE